GDVLVFSAHRHRVCGVELYEVHRCGQRVVGTGDCDDVVRECGPLAGDARRAAVGDEMHGTHRRFGDVEAALIVGLRFACRAFYPHAHSREWVILVVEHDTADRRGSGWAALQG